jgi:hypothetical protein
MPPVSGLLQPIEIRLALEKLVPAKGPAEKISGLSGDKGSTVAAPRSSRVLAMKCRPTRASAAPVSSSVSTERSFRLMCRYVRISRALFPVAMKTGGRGRRGRSYRARPVRERGNGRAEEGRHAPSAGES